MNSRLKDDQVMQIRIETLGWAFDEICRMVDKGIDPRTFEVPKMIERLVEDFD